MKLTAALPPLVAGIAIAAVGLPVLQQKHVVAKRASPELIRREEAEVKRINAALKAFRNNDAAGIVEARRTIAALRPGDLSRPLFAALLSERGEARVAFEVERAKARWDEWNAPDDGEMALYARLADAVGESEEAAWARARTGPEGHYRVWRQGVSHDFYDTDIAAFGHPLTYMGRVNSAMDDGLEKHPRFRERIEALRRELLARSPL